MRMFIFIVVMAVFMVSCGDTDKDPVKDDDPQNDEDTVVVTDDESDADEEPTDSDLTDFAIRKPGSKEIECGEFGKTELYDLDFICKFSHENVDAMIYFQTSPETCSEYGAPINGIVLAQIKDDGAVTSIKTASYDYGGNHHNDSLTFTYENITFKFYHSTFGWGWRSCQPMDCAQILDQNGGLSEDGCTCDRTIPVICKEIKADGTYDELVDTYEVCAGDSECGETNL